MKNSIVVIGTTFVDIKGYPFAKYIPGGRNAGRVVQVHGGVSRNVVEDIANVELRPTFVTVVNDDGAGLDVLEKLARHKVNIRYARRVHDSMGTWLAVFDHTGDVIASISKRPDPSAISDILREQGDEIFAEADAVAVEADIDDGIMKQILSLAEKHRKQVYALVSNMSIALERRDLLRSVDCFVCNVQEAGQFFSEEYTHLTPEELSRCLADRVRAGELRRMVVTLGGQGAVYADADGSSGVIPALKVDVIDTTGCGDAFFAGVCIGLTYGKTLPESCRIGTRLAGSVITTRENVCPRFLPAEFDLPEPDAQP